jgi:MFS family permease
MKERAYKNHLLVMLLLTLAFNAKDRLLFGLALQDIKTDLVLSDTQLGFVTGIAFALFYATAGIPIARWADRGNRVAIIAACTALWSVAVALCGVAVTYVQLLLIRIGVAVGEAGCVPPALSLISDTFSRDARPRAIAIFKLGTPFSALIGYFLAGWLIHLYGWRTTFLLLGLPGVPLALLLWFTLREPRVGNVSADGVAQPVVSSEPQVSLRQVLTTLWNIKTFRHLALGFSVSAFFANGVAQWQPAFFMRSYGMGPVELGTWFAGVYGATGLIGTYVGGMLAFRYAARNESLQLRTAALAYAVLALMSFAIYFSASPYTAIMLTGIATLGTSAVSGPLFATMQTLVPANMRALSMAILLLIVSLIGVGIGPLSVGVLSDALRSWAGDESLRYALLAFSPGYLWCAWHFWRASATVHREIGDQDESVPIEDASHPVTVRRSVRNGWRTQVSSASD